MCVRGEKIRENAWVRVKEGKRFTAQYMSKKYKIEDMKGLNDEIEIYLVNFLWSEHRQDTYFRECIHQSLPLSRVHQIVLIFPVASAPNQWNYHSNCAGKALSLWSKLSTNILGWSTATLHYQSCRHSNIPALLFPPLSAADSALLWTSTIKSPPLFTTVSFFEWRRKPGPAK